MQTQAPPFIPAPSASTRWTGHRELLKGVARAVISRRLRWLFLSAGCVAAPGTADTEVPLATPGEVPRTDVSHAASVRAWERG